VKVSGFENNECIHLLSSFVCRKSRKDTYSLNLEYSHIPTRIQQIVIKSYLIISHYVRLKIQLLSTTRTFVIALTTQIVEEST
jgi:hypothetical protein